MPNSQSDSTRDIHFSNQKDISKKSQSKKADHLLIIGIDDYNSQIPKLNNAVRDAKEFERIMHSKYSISSTLTLYNSEATREGIFDAFEILQNKITADDNILIYFSGHGEMINNRGYWIPSDGKRAKINTYISNNDIKDFLHNLNAHHIFCIVDACFSGSLILRSSAEVANRYYSLPSRWIMTSGQLEVVPDGLPGYHSPFAKSLLTQLEMNPNPFLSISQLWIDMREGVVANSKQTPICAPLVESNHQGGEFFFIKKDIKQIPSFLIDEDIVEQTRGFEKESISDFKKNLRLLLTQQKAKEAFNLLSEKLNENSSHKQIVFVRLAHLNNLEKNIATGIAQNELRQKAQINTALNYVIDNLHEEDLIK